ncbi:MAG: hypothetical protein I3273_02035 [Candidatus Moeniiplasma glomeromycotorum]|nr:hypothetical protein [Candidatus Moeniiplasma glomeromycotorum]MCE8167101.1 hypothetical protein [Candidatus Moeniiplasma glomeromycotorum]MCE8168887.1 hypothetical protein [Candidatus Moeniiplasma glomeromycotorum]
MFSQPESKKKKSLIIRLGPFCFFALIALPPTLILAVLLLVLYFKGIKSPLHDLLADIMFPPRGSFRRFNIVRNIFGAFGFLFALVSCLLIILYVFFFLVKSLKSKHWHRTAYYLFFWLSSQGLVGWLTYYLYFQKNIILKLTPFLLLPFVNGFFLHYFFSKPVMKLLHSRYPDYFPAFFDTQPGTYVEADGLPITVKKPRATFWALMLTLSLVNFHIFTFLILILYYKN